ncbi:hypothetical protein ABZ639_26250 [Saccharomonospora sp. NPDC006951]
MGSKGRLAATVTAAMIGTGVLVGAPAAVAQTAQSSDVLAVSPPVASPGTLVEMRLTASVTCPGPSVPQSSALSNITVIHAAADGTAWQGTVKSVNAGTYSITAQCQTAGKKATGTLEVTGSQVSTRPSGPAHTGGGGTADEASSGGGGLIGTLGVVAVGAVGAWLVLRRRADSRG